MQPCFITNPVMIEKGLDDNDVHNNMLSSNIVLITMACVHACTNTLDLNTIQRHSTSSSSYLTLDWPDVVYAYIWDECNKIWTKRDTIYSKLATVSLKCPPSLNDLKRHNISWRPFLQCFLGQEVNIISNDCPLLSARPKIIFFEPSCYRVVPHSQPITRIKVGWHPFTGSKGNYFASFINHQL